MKKLKMSDELLQHAKKLTRENQKKILGGYGPGSGGGSITNCYYIKCLAQSGALLGIVSAPASSPCGWSYNNDYLACVSAGYNVYSAACGC